MDMHWGQYIGLVVTMLGACAYIRKETRAEIQEIKNDAKIQAARTDKLYEMFCQLREENDKKFYDLLKERK